MTRPRTLHHLLAPLLIAGLLAGAGLGLTGCGGASAAQRGPAVGPVDELLGSYRDVSVGAPTSRVQAELGPPLGNFDPYLKAADYPPFLAADNAFNDVYPDADYAFDAGRVSSITVYGRGASTRAGLRLGDRLARVRTLYPTAVCRPGHPPPAPEAPGCQVSLPAHRYLWIGGDPVAVITLSIYPLLVG